MKKKNLLRFIPLMALLLLLLCPLQVHAANYIYVRKGVTGSITFKSSPVPNARWKVGNSSVLKLKSSTSKSVSYTGKKVGKTTLTVYNSKKTSQKYVWTVYVMPSKKLLKMDFELYGSRPRNVFGVKEGENIFNRLTGEYNYIILVREAGVTRSTSASFFQTTRTLKFYDSYSRFCTLYGNLSLKTYISSKDRYRKYVSARKSSSYQSTVNSFFNQNVYYYTDCKYNNTYMIRFLFDRSKELSGVIYFKNYNKLPINWSFDKSYYVGCSITSGQILAKIPTGTDSVYVRVDENKLYYVLEDGDADIRWWENMPGGVGTSCRR